MWETANDTFAEFYAKLFKLSLEAFIIKRLGIKANKFDSLHPYQIFEDFILS